METSPNGRSITLGAFWVLGLFMSHTIGAEYEKRKDPIHIDLIRFTPLNLA